MPALRSCHLVLGALCTVAVLSTSQADTPETERPHIGILAVPFEGEPECDTFGLHAGTVSEAASCFAAFYVKWIESSGARAVAIPYNLPVATIDQLLDSVNAVLFTGGGLSLKPDTEYYKTAKHIFDRVLQKNDGGEHFPIWGTCMGFQLLSLLAADNQTVLDRYAFDSENISLPLSFTDEGTKSRFYEAIPEHIRQSFSHNITSNLHHDGVKPETFQTNAKLASFFRLVATSVDRQNKAFGSVIEAKNYPITGVQWHPERPQFEWRLGKGINHSLEAIEAMQWTGRYLSSLARLNSQEFTNSTLENTYSIYTHQVVLDPSGGSYQYYVFD